MNRRSKENSAVRHLDKQNEDDKRAAGFSQLNKGRLDVLRSLKVRPPSKKLLDLNALSLKLFKTQEKVDDRDPLMAHFMDDLDDDEKVRIVYFILGNAFFRPVSEDKI
jgi:hypothetical protein